ncbi:MAG: hypothetical protein NTV87_09080 [Ignavibacteriae bacterium]|jgi:hypothetical protein|nr:hypothetical protein [Ignavibacteriota bacterium]
MSKTFTIRKILFLLIMLSGSIVFATVSFQYFTARPNSDGVIVEWKTGDEGGTVKFDIERSAVTPDNFIQIKTINATGGNSYYSYQDNSVNFKNGASSSIYYYRLKCVLSNGSYSYTSTISVVHTVSGIKNTWGSIKAIFR